MKERDPFWAQKTISKENRKRVLSALLKRPMTNKELLTESGLSKPVLSNHLKILRKQGVIAKDLIDDKIVYKLGTEAAKLPLVHSLIFENGAYLRIQRELVKEREAYLGKERVIRQDTKASEVFSYLELDPQFIADTTEKDIVQAIDKWLTPIVLYAIIQELKTRDKWTSVASGLFEKLIELVKQKDVHKFEDALRSRYSKTLVPRYFFLPSERVSIIDSLDDIIDHIEIQKKIETKRREARG